MRLSLAWRRWAPVCFPFAEPNVEYRVNYLISDLGVVQESCTDVGSANVTCMACTLRGRRSSLCVRGTDLVDRSVRAR